MDMLRAAGGVPLAPLAVRFKPGERGVKRAQARLLPGYVFFDYEGTPDWDTIRRYSSVLKVLQYEDGERALRDGDLAFVRWLKQYDGLIDISEVVKVGTKIVFVSGPLVGMEAQVLKVNKSRRQVQIAFGDESAIFHQIWCSIEYIEQYTDMDMTHRETSKA